MRLYDSLLELKNSDEYPYHMPGHKRRDMGSFMEGLHGIDITEIDGFDNLHHASGIIETAQNNVAKMYGAECTHFCVNGSTGGVLSAITACCYPQESILMARNCHKSAYNAVQLLNLRPFYVYPKEIGEYDLCGPIDAEEIHEILLKEPSIRAVIITSPTYEGIVSDVEAIAKVVHSFHIPLIVDSAHGAHLGLLDGKEDCEHPRNAVACGADLVVHSSHKTLPALTQTALVHCNGTLVDREKLSKALSIYQTTSPSYVLMASIEECFYYLSQHGKEWFAQFDDNMRVFRENCQSLKHIKVLSYEDLHHFCPNVPFSYDYGKIIISGAQIGMTGREIYDILKGQHHLQLEMSVGSYALAMMTIFDTKEGFQRLANALMDIDRNCETKNFGTDKKNYSHLTCKRVETVMTCADAEKMAANPANTCIKNIEESVVTISTEYAFFYPPGIPILVPGERITKEVVDGILAQKQNGYKIQGLKDPSGDTILVLLK